MKRLDNAVLLALTLSISTAIAQDADAPKANQPTISIPPPPPTADVRELAEQARRRRAEAALTESALEQMLKANPAPQPGYVEQLSAEAQQRYNAYLQSGRNTLYRKLTGSLAPSGPTTDDSPWEQPVSGQFVVALSSAMPTEMVRDYVRQLDGLPEAIIVLRGMIGGLKTITPTAKWVESIRRKQPDCQSCGYYSVRVVVDPLLYRSLHIEQVPVVAWMPGVQSIKHCDGEDFSAAIQVAGAARLDAVLSRMQQLGAQVPEPVLRHFQPKEG